MKTAPRIATAVAVGYVLGRTRRMKLAITIGGMLAGRRSAAAPKEAGGKLLSSPQVVSLTNELRGKLLEAVRAAASSQIEDLSHRLTERAENLRSPHKDERAKDEESTEEQAPADEQGSTGESGTASGSDTSARSGGGRSRKRSDGTGGERPRRSGSSSGSTGRRAEETRTRPKAKPTTSGRGERGDDDG